MSRDNIFSFGEELPSSALIDPYDETIKIDYAGLIAYAQKHYDGNISKMSEEEVRQFVADLSEQRKSA